MIRHAEDAWMSVVAGSGASAVLITGDACHVDDRRAAMTHKNAADVTDRVPGLFAVPTLGALDLTLLAVEARMRDVHGHFSHAPPRP